MQIQAPQLTQAVANQAQTGLRMASQSPIITTAGHSAELLANAARYQIGGSYWSRMGAMLFSIVPAGIGGSIAGATTGFTSALLGASEALAGGIGTIVGIGSTLGLYPVTFKQFGRRFLSVIPK